MKILSLLKLVRNNWMLSTLHESDRKHNRAFEGKPNVSKVKLNLWKVWGLMDQFWMIMNVLEPKWTVSKVEDQYEDFKKGNQNHTENLK